MKAKTPFTSSARGKEQNEKTSLFFMFLLFGMFRQSERGFSMNGFQELLDDSARKAGINLSDLGQENSQRVQEAQAHALASGRTFAPADQTAVRHFSRAASMSSASHVGLQAGGLTRNLLDVIAKPESGGDYNIAHRSNPRPQTSDGRVLEQMTIKEVIAWQERRIAAGSPSSAVGRYQIINNTLEGLVREMKLSGNEVFDRDMQDRMAIRLMERRGLHAFLEGRIGIDRMMRNLSQEWAGLPKDHSNLSYYDGDGLNRAGIRASVVADSLQQTRVAFRENRDVMVAVGATPSNVLAQRQEGPNPTRT